MLTRQAIRSGRFLESFDSLPKDVLWTQARIDESLSQTLAQRPAEADDVWVFAYGSLMWNPLANFDRRQVADLHDWHRSFCLRLIAGRGSPEHPGRMLALEPRGCTRGVALRLHRDTFEEELRIIWTREMVTGAYKPTWAPVTLDDGSETFAIAFIADPERAHYEPDARAEVIAPLMAVASGLLGTNAEYVFKLQQALADCGVKDPYIERLAAELLRAMLSSRPAQQTAQR